MYEWLYAPQYMAFSYFGTYAPAINNTEGAFHTGVLRLFIYVLHSVSNLCVISGSCACVWQRTVIGTGTRSVCDVHGAAG
jgi:hypothetical protein